MPITKDKAKISVFVPNAISGAAVTNVEGFDTQLPFFVAIFPKIYEFPNDNGFGNFFEFRWAAYIVSNGNECVIISQNERFASLIEEIKTYECNNILNYVPLWYVEIMQKNEIAAKISSNLMNLLIEKKDIALYAHCIIEYGFLLGQNKSDKPYLFDNKQVVKLSIQRKLIELSVLGRINSEIVNELTHKINNLK